MRLQGGSLPGGTVLTMADGYASSVPTNAVLDLNGNSQTLAGLQSTSNGGLGEYIMNSSSTSSTLTVNNTAATVFGGVIGLNTTTVTTNQAAGTGNINLVKTGPGTLTLGGANTYTGTDHHQWRRPATRHPFRGRAIPLGRHARCHRRRATVVDSAGGGHTAP